MFLFSSHPRERLSMPSQEASLPEEGLVLNRMLTSPSHQP